MRLAIRTRLTLISAALMAAVLVSLGSFLYVRLHADLLEALDDRLRDRATILIESPDSEAAIRNALADSGDAYAQMLTANGDVLASSPGLTGGPLLRADQVRGLGAATFFDAPVRTIEEVVPARLLAVQMPEGLLMVVGATVEDQQDATSRLLALLLVGGPVALGLASGVGWLVAGAALRPMERLRIEAEAISGSEPGRRLVVPPTGDELARLGVGLNRMLNRLDVAAERERRFVGDASHELRTPLANLRAELDLALRRARTPAELVAALTSAAEETDRLTRLAEDLLVLARGDGGHLAIRREELDLGSLIRDTVDGFVSRAIGLGVGLQATAAAGVTARVDPTRLRQALGNLLDNALRHTPSGGRVTVELFELAGDIGIRVTDSGAGFVPGFLARAFEPFSRAETATSDAETGAGLGLAIVRAVAEAHGGSVEASNPPEGGATVLLRFPA